VDRVSILDGADDGSGRFRALFRRHRFVQVGSKRLPSASIGRTRKRSNASVSRRLRRLRSATLPAARLLADRSKRALQVVGDGQELARKIRDRGLPRLAVGEQ
jgi:hypothetical protein